MKTIVVIILIFVFIRVCFKLKKKYYIVYHEGNDFTIEVSLIKPFVGSNEIDFYLLFNCDHIGYRFENRYRNIDYKGKIKKNNGEIIDDFVLYY